MPREILSESQGELLSLFAGAVIHKTNPSVMEVMRELDFNPRSKLESCRLPSRSFDQLPK